MTRAGRKIIEGAKEALAIVRGEKKPVRVYGCSVCGQRDAEWQSTHLLAMCPACMARTRRRRMKTNRPPLRKA